MAAAPGPAPGSGSPATLFPLSSGRQGLARGTPGSHTQTAHCHAVGLRTDEAHEETRLKVSGDPGGLHAESTHSVVHLPTTERPLWSGLRGCKCKWSRQPGGRRRGAEGRGPWAPVGAGGTGRLSEAGWLGGPGLPGALDGSLVLPAFPVLWPVTASPARTLPPGRVVSQSSERAPRVG